MEEKKFRDYEFKQEDITVYGELVKRVKHVMPFLNIRKGD